jgi:hypothetical protein
MAANDFSYASIPLATDVAVKNTEASADIPAGSVVKLDATKPISGTQGVPGVLLTTASTEYPLGVAMETIKNGKQGLVRPIGVAQVVANAAVAVGAVVMPGASGKVATQTAAKPQVGIALTATAADNDKLLVLIQPAFNA